MAEKITDLRTRRVAGLKLKLEAAKLPLQQASFAHQIAVLEAGENVDKITKLRGEYNEIKAELLAKAAAEAAAKAAAAAKAEAETAAAEVVAKAAAATKAEAETATVAEAIAKAAAAKKGKKK